MPPFRRIPPVHETAVGLYLLRIDQRFDQMHRKLPALRGFGIAISIFGATLFGAAGAYASDTSAHVDMSQPNAQPAYPDSAKAAGEQGAVLIDVLVRPSGHVSKFRVAQSSGFGDLDQAAVQSVLNWKYVPATRDGNAVEDWTTVKVVFQLPQTAAAAPPAPAQ
jgi:TonB family protein